ncbi:MAG: CDP-archaeol synthase [Planctomycetota bacterium]
MLRALWLFAPLLFAAAVAAVVQRRNLLRWARRPVDGGLEWRGRRVFGDNKTWRGFLVAIVGGAAFALLQKHAVGSAAAGVLVVDWNIVPAALFGAAMGLGAMLGELPNSFVKRRLAIAPGTATTGTWSVVFYVWDQVDLLTGAWPLIWMWVHPRPLLVAASFALALVVHPVLSLMGWLLGARISAR